MLDLTQKDGWGHVGTAIVILAAGICITSVIDALLTCAAESTRCKSSSVLLWRVFHAIFHTTNILLLFLTLWFTVLEIMSEDAAGKLFGGLAVGIGFALQGVLQCVVAYFTILFAGEISTDSTLRVTLDGAEPREGIILEISTFHVKLQTNTGTTYVSNSKLLDATFTVKPKATAPAQVTRATKESTYRFVR